MVPLLLAVLIHLVLWGSAVVGQGYGWNEMDWNSDGRTSVIELLESADIGRREQLERGVTCIDYFSYKDGLSVRKWCRH